MKRIIILIAACLAVFSCAKDYDGSDLGPVKLKMSVLPAGTKAFVTSGADLWLDDVQIFVFDRDGNIEAYSGEVEPDDDIELEVVPGTKTLWAVGNAPYSLTPDTLEDLESEVFELNDNTLDKLIMSDRKTISVTGSQDVEFSLQRLVCKIVLDKVVRDFEEPAYAEIPLIIKKVYLSNVASTTNLLAEAGVPGSFCVQNGVIGELPDNASSLIVDSGLNYTLNEGGTYNVTHTFYAYPNGSTSEITGGQNFTPRRTRLIVQCEYNGQTCYYPVTLPGIVSGSRGSLERNKVYHINTLTLTRPGSGDPDQPTGEVSSVQDCTFNITVESWSSGHDYNETFR